MWIKAIALHQRNICPETIFDDRGEIRIEFASYDLGAGFDERFGERSGSRADFQDEFAGLKFGRINKFSQDILVVKEYLPQPVLGAQSAFSQDRSDFRKRLHLI